MYFIKYLLANHNLCYLSKILSTLHFFFKNKIQDVAVDPEVTEGGDKFSNN